jgi:hypothetical protein
LIIKNANLTGGPAASQPLFGIPSTGGQTARFCSTQASLYLSIK